MYISPDHIHVQLHNMDIVWLYTMTDNDSQENDYHIWLTNNNNIFHKSYPNEHKSNLHCTALTDHGHKDSRYGVSFLTNDCYDDLVRSVDNCVGDEMTRNEYDVMMMMIDNDLS